MKSILLVTTLLLSLQAHAKLTCTADFSALDDLNQKTAGTTQKTMAKVTIEDETKSLVTGTMSIGNNTLAFKDAKVHNYTVREDLNLADAYEEQNRGEAAVKF